MGLRAEISGKNKSNLSERSSNNSNIGHVSRVIVDPVQPLVDCPNEEHIGAMAPALPESINNSSTAPNLTNVNIKTDVGKRINKKPNLSPTDNKTLAESTTTTATNKRTNRGGSASANTPPPTTSSRITRSKDAKQRNLEQQSLFVTTAAVTNLPNGATTTQKLLDSKLLNEADSVEQMGLSVALNNNNEKNSTAEQQSCDTDSVANQQLLADLSQNFEGAINAEICLRNQLEDVNLCKSARDAKEVLLIKAASENTIEAVAANAKATTHTRMESAVASDVAQENKEKSATTTNLKPISKTIDQAANVNQLDKETDDRPKVISVEELPAVSTDSTISASENEDNIEERLSQLDSTALSETCLIAEKQTQLTHHESPSKTNSQLQFNQQLLQTLQHSPVSQQRIITAQTTQSLQSNSNAAAATAVTAEIDHDDIEEVLKVLKGIEGAQGTDSIGDLNAFLNEVYPYCEDVANQQSAAAAASVIGSSSSNAGINSRTSPLKEFQLEADKRNQLMTRKLDFLVKRLRKTQARHMCKQSSEEIAGLFELFSRHANKSALSGQKEDNNRNSIMQSSSIDMKPTVSSKQLQVLLQKIEMTASCQQLNTCSSGNNNNNNSSSSKIMLKKMNRKAKDGAWPSGVNFASSLASSPVPPVRKYAETVVPILKSEYVDEVRRVSGFLKTQLRQVQNAIDSDATESSSGGESADEMISYNNQSQKQLSISKRAAMIYSRDRAAIASRWTWILSQVADLEIKIRQHAELKQDIKRTQGSVIATAAAHPNDTAVISVNGYKNERLTAAVDAKEVVSSPEDSCCRTRAFPTTQFRKRKLLPTNNIHTISKKAARPSNIKCGCQWPHMPCALCTGRVDPTAPRDLMDTMMLSERAALLDPGFHPVLSFAEEIDLSIRNESHAHSADWQQRNMRAQPKSLLKMALKNERDLASAFSFSTPRKYGAVSGSTMIGVDTIKRRRRYRKKANSAAGEETHGTTTAAAAACSSETGNGTGILSTTTTTPLAANSKLL